MGAHADAAHASGKSVTLDAGNVDYLIKHSRDLLDIDRLDDALATLYRALKLEPTNQLAWACLGVCWEKLGDPRWPDLCDYEHFIREYRIEPPACYTGIDDLNSQLALTLDELHALKHHPADQSLRHGTQTVGSLFNRDLPGIVDLVSSLDRAITEYIAYLSTIDLPLDGLTHPLLGYIGSGYKFAGSWSVRLWSSGYHINHVHPRGWISSAYYVTVPEMRPASGQDHSGCLSFGQIDMLGEGCGPKRIIAPAPGNLVLFPSYFWHGTFPFQSEECRLTVAFDAVPTNRP